MAILDPNEAQVDEKWPIEYFRLLIDVEDPATVLEKAAKFKPKFQKNAEATICATFCLAKAHFKLNDFEKAENIYWECHRAQKPKREYNLSIIDLMHIRLREDKIDDAIKIGRRRSDPELLSEETEEFLQDLIRKRK